MSQSDALFEKQNECDKLKKKLSAYQEAVNKIDDFFEYANESKSDRERVHEILDNLTLKLSTIK
jgi:hypothetical protein